MDDTGHENFEDDTLSTPATADEKSQSIDPFMQNPAREGDGGGALLGRGGVITARGTVDGVVVRLDGRVDRDSLRSAIEDFLSARRAFLAGNEVSLEWVGARPEESLLSEISALLLNNFNITVKSSKLRDAIVLDNDTPTEDEPLIRRRAAGREGNIGRESSARREPTPHHRLETARPKSLFDGMEALSDTRPNPSINRGNKGIQTGQSNLSQVESFWDDADARIVYTTLRSGQKIETDHSLVVFGDVNSGAEIVAGGDIVVLGTLRGVAHAGAYDETGGGRVIFALNLQATQLRIGMVISRGSAESQKAPEIARVEGGLIVVEPYSVKNLGSARNLGSRT